MKKSDPAKNPSPEKSSGSKAINTPLGIYQFRLNELEVTIFRDGHFPLSFITPPDMEPAHSIGINIDDETRMDYFGSRMDRNSDFQLNISPVLLDFGDRQILVDSGWNLDEGVPTAGNLGSMLDVAGVTPEEIDTVILTHAHPDHLGGLVHPTDQEAAFPNAEVVITETEHAFWNSDDATTFLENPLFGSTLAILDSMDDRLRMIRAGDEIARGIRSIPSPGHTPGHVSLEVEAGNQQLLLTGDAITNNHTSFEHPDWHNFYDLDPDLASESRKQLLDQAVAEDMLILGYHLPFPGVGYALRFKDSYHWYPTA